MVTLRSWDEEHGSTDDVPRTTDGRIRRYLVVLTSDEECVTQEVEWPPAVAAAVSALCRDINSQATWSASPRMHVNPIVPADPQGEVA